MGKSISGDSFANVERIAVARGRIQLFDLFIIHSLNDSLAAFERVIADEWKR